MISLTLTAKVLTQSADKIDLDAEQRKTKLRSLLVLPSSTSALPQTNAQQISSTLSQDTASETNLSNTSQTNKSVENNQSDYVVNVLQVYGKKRMGFKLFSTKQLLKSNLRASSKAVCRVDSFIQPIIN